MCKRVYICSTGMGLSIFNLFNISNNLFDFLTSNNLGVESEAGFGM